MPARVAVSTVAMTAYNLLTRSRSPQELRKACGEVHPGVSDDDFQAAAEGLQQRGLVVVDDGGSYRRTRQVGPVVGRDRTGDGWGGWRARVSSGPAKLVELTAAPSARADGS